MVEVRFDMMDELPHDLTLFRSIPVPLIATLRSVTDGGKYSGDDEEKVKLLTMAADNGFAFIDSESVFKGSDVLKRTSGNTRLIVSYHDHERTPKVSDIVHILVSCSSKGDVAKVAFRANTFKDVLSLVEASKAYSETGKEFVAISMGEKGVVTRVLFERLGASFTYASLEKGREVAPGQMDVSTLKALSGDIVVTGVTGRSLSHSLSPWMHNAAFSDLGIPGIYLKFQAEHEELPDLLGLMVELGIRGTNVTIPHKEAVIPLLDSIDPEAERIGAVNTVKNDDGSLVGFNTDVYGVRMTFEKNRFAPKGKKVLVMGAGGAARAVSAYLSSEGADIFIANRTAEKARALAEAFDGITVIKVEEVPDHHFDAMVNCTPLGMKGYPDEISIPAEAIREGQFIMDTIYNPPMTKLVAEGLARGATAVSGKDMLIFQAMQAFEIWTGVRPKYEVMRAGFEEGMSR